MKYFKYLLSLAAFGLAAWDERARRADSLSVGAFSSPFFHKSGFSIVRLDRREPSRTKTFEEAGPEISTAYQDYESKRLESVWIDGLRRDFKVVEHPEVLQSAFAPAQQIAVAP